MGLIKQNLGTAVLAVGMALGWAAPVQAALYTIDLSGPSVGVDCFLGVCNGQRYTLLDGSFMTATATNSLGTTAKVARYNSGGVKGLGVDSGPLDDKAVDFFETLVLTFSKEHLLYGWSMTDTGLFSSGGSNKFSLSVDGGPFTQYDIGDRAAGSTALLTGFSFSFRANNDDSFVLNAVVVPEATSMAMALGGLAMLGALARMQRRRVS